MSDLGGIVIGIGYLLAGAAYVGVLLVVVIGWIHCCARFPHTWWILPAYGIVVVSLKYWIMWRIWSGTGFPEEGILRTALIIVQVGLVAICLQSVVGWCCWGRERLRSRRSAF